MDQKLSAKSSAWASILGITCGICMLPVALGAVASFPDPIGWLGLLLGLCGCMVGYFSYVNLKRARKLYKETDEKVQSILDTASSENSVVQPAFNPPDRRPSSAIVLAIWEYSKEEWHSFQQWERRDRKFSGIANFIVVSALACFLIEIKSEAGWFNSILLSLPIAAIYTWVTMIFSRSSFGKANQLKNNQVVLTTHAAIINQKFNEFISENKSIKEVRIIEEAEPKILEIEYEWQTKGGKSSDRLHLPIPKGKLGEAVKLMDKLLIG